MPQLTLRTFTEDEYHRFFRGYVPDPVMDPHPFVYNEEQVDRSYRYNHFFRENYAHYGIFLDDCPIGCFQLKRIDTVLKKCEFGLILQNDALKDHGYGTEAIRLGMEIARTDFGMESVWGDTSSRNSRMQHIFEKLGFRLVERIPDAFEYSENDKTDVLVYQYVFDPDTPE